jgi:hypothetical protein
MPVSGSQIVAAVEHFKGYPYVYGATGPSSFDCSGLVQYVLTHLGIKDVPRTSEAQYAWAQHVSKAQLQPGDLVFAQFPGDNASPGHVGVYVGGGQVLSAEDPASGVGMSSLASWGNAVVGFGRVPNTATASGGGGGWISHIPVIGPIVGGVDATAAFLGHLDSAFGELWSMLMAIFNPSTYVRIAAGLGGALLLAFGAWFLIKAAT